MTTRSNSTQDTEDQQRRDAITQWWVDKTFRDFIAAKRAELKAKAQQ